MSIQRVRVRHVCGVPFCGASCNEIVMSDVERMKKEGPRREAGWRRRTISQRVAAGRLSHGGLLRAAEKDATKMGQSDDFKKAKEKAMQTNGLHP